MTGALDEQQPSAASAAAAVELELEVERMLAALELPELAVLLQRGAGDQAMLSQAQLRVLEDAIRARCKEATASIAAAAMASGDDGDGELDGSVTQVFAFLSAATKLVPLDATAAQLRRWLPHALLACAFVACERLSPAKHTHLLADADVVLARCQELTGAQSRADVLAQFVGPLMALCSQSCSKEQWVDRRSLPKHALLWIVLQVPFPHLGGDLLGRLLALVFPLVDDLSNESQAVGARLLQHIVHNVTATELRWYSDVLLEVLRTAITSRQPATLDALLDALVAALDKLSPPGEFAHFDKFFPRLLTDTSLSTDVEVRVLFLRRLRPAIARMGAPQSVHVIRYLQPLLKVVVATFESINVALLLETLETLRVTIVSAWPRIPAHAEEIFVGVMRAVSFCEVFDAGTSSSATASEREQILASCERVLELLHDLTGSESETDTLGQPRSKSSSAVVRMLQEVAASSAALRAYCEHMCSHLVGSATCVDART